MRKLLPLIVAMLLSGVLSAQTKQDKTRNTKGSSPAWVNNIPTKDIITWRRHIHQNPELSFEEEKTGKYVEDIEPV